MVETHKRKRKNTVMTNITLTISNAEHIKQTLSTNKPYRHQQHLPKISHNFSRLPPLLFPNPSISPTRPLSGTHPTSPASRSRNHCKRCKQDNHRANHNNVFLYQP